MVPRNSVHCLLLCRVWRRDTLLQERCVLVGYVSFAPGVCFREFRDHFRLSFILLGVYQIANRGAWVYGNNTRCARGWCFCVLYLLCVWLPCLIPCVCVTLCASYYTPYLVQYVASHTRSLKRDCRVSTSMRGSRVVEISFPSPVSLSLWFAFVITLNGLPGII